jgi:hypothetical protein
MLSIIAKIIFSFLIIYIGHQTWVYCKNTYSVKKTKYVVGSQIDKYKTILEEITNAETDLKTDLEDYMRDLQQM